MGAVKTKGTKTAEKPSPLDEAGSSPELQSSKATGKSLRSSKAVAEASAVFKMVGDPIRLNLLLTLVEGEGGGGDLCAHRSEPTGGISHHLALLRQSGGSSNPAG